MVKLNKIYTRTGDGGFTGLSDGARRAKHDRRIAAIGVIDEANCCIGLARAQMTQETNNDGIDATLARVQNDLFDLGADLSTPESDNPRYPPLRIEQTQVDWLEQEIDRLNAELNPLNSFILPGGTVVAASLHLARATVRRAERLMTQISLEQNEKINASALSYVNRLSDLLFVVSRFLNDKGASDILWVPGANR